VAGGRSSEGFERTAKRAVRDAEPWLVWLGRFGYIAKGVVYTLIGVLAILAAIGAGGETIGTTGAFQKIGEASFGQPLLITIGVGLLGYALWRFVQAFMDTENKGADLKGIAVRASYFVIGVVHAALALSAFRLIADAGAASGSDGDSTRGWTVELMSQPYGRWLVGIIGAIVCGRGAFHMYRAFSLKFREKLQLGEMSAREEKWALRLGRMGYGARGFVFTIIGAFLIVAAIREDANQARGLGGALHMLAQQPWGSVLLGAVAVGLAAYGLYLFVEARFRRMVIT
jgi:hypothetical protein